MGSRSTTTTESEPWAPAQGALKDVLSQTKSLYQSGELSADPYSGSMVAGFGDVSQMAQQGIIDQASQDSPLLSGMSGTLADMMSGDYQTQYLENVKQNALGTAIPAAASMFSGSGMTDSSTAMDYVGRSAAEAVAPYEYQAAEAAQNRALQAAGMAPTAYQSGFLPQQMLASVGSQQDAMAQQMLDADIAAHYEAENQQRQALENYANLATAIGGMGGTSQGSSYQPMGVGGALSILGSGLSLFSDRRLKENVVKIGETPSGTNIYSYTYKGSNVPQVGVMADEVPHAISGEIGGYSVVDYGRVS